MLESVASGYKGFTSLLDMAKSILEVRDAAARQMVTYEFTKELLTAQEAHTTLVQSVSDLKEELVRFETWEAEKQRYILTDLGDGKFVYTLEEVVDSPEPPHDICAGCYQSRRKSVLQKQHWQPLRAEVLICHACAAVIYLKGFHHHAHPKITPTFTGS